MKKIRNIKASLRDAEMHLDPVQQEYEALMQEVDQLQKSCGGEELMYEFIENLRIKRRQGNKKDDDDEKRPWRI